MRLVQAVDEAISHGYKWVAIDDDGQIYAYHHKPHHYVGSQWYHYSHYLLGTCSTPLGGTWEDWIIDVRKIQ